MIQSLYAIRLIFLSFGLAISSWAPLIPILKMRLGFDDAELGSVLLISGIGALLSMPLAGWIMAKVGSRSLVILSGFFTLACLPLLAQASTTMGLCLTLFLFGIAGGAMNVSMNAQAVNIENAAGIPILSGIHCWFSIGGLLGPLIIGFLLHYSISVVYSAAILSSFILLILLTQSFYLLKSSLAKNSQNQSKSSVFHKQAIILGALCFIAFMTEGSMLDWSAEYLSSNLNYELSIAGIGYSAFSIAMAVGRFLGNRVIKNFGVQLVFQLGCCIAAIGLAIIVTAFYTQCEILGFILIGLGASNVVPILFSSSGKLDNISSNTSLTIVTTFGCMGLLIGPAGIGFLAEATSLSLSFFLMACLLGGIGIYGSRIIASINNEKEFSKAEV